MNTSIATPASPAQAGAEILDRILAVRGNLIALDGGEITEVAGIAEGVEVDDRLAAGSHPVEHKIRANEPGAAGHQDSHE